VVSEIPFRSVAAAHENEKSPSSTSDFRWAPIAVCQTASALFEERCKESYKHKRI
jgi:hypothetical protein